MNKELIKAVAHNTVECLKPDSFRKEQQDKFDKFISALDSVLTIQLGYYSIMPGEEVLDDIQEELKILKAMIETIETALES